MADHVLVDEGQDLSPTHGQLLRALVAPGADDLFIAEDSHQHIYGPRLVLSRYGIRIVGRSQRLTLNYRTTAQNLRYAMAVLEGASYVDREDQPEATGYRCGPQRPGPGPGVRHHDQRRARRRGGARARLDQRRRRPRDGRDPGPRSLPAGTGRQQSRRTWSRGACSRPREPPDRPAVMTMHRAKGMEFSKVVLAGIGASLSATGTARLDAMDEAERADAELRERSLVYVATTRARDELVVVRRT